MLGFQPVFSYLRVQDRSPCVLAEATSKSLCLMAPLAAHHLLTTAQRFQLPSGQLLRYPRGRVPWNIKHPSPALSLPELAGNIVLRVISTLYSWVTAFSSFLSSSCLFPPLSSFPPSFLRQGSFHWVALAGMYLAV